MFFRHVILYDIIHVFTTNERIFCRCIFTTKKESKKLIRFFDSFIHSILYSNMNSYFLKKSGILIDCSFTRLVGVLGVSMEGDVPPTVQALELPAGEPAVCHMQKHVLYV